MEHDEYVHLASFVLPADGYAVADTAWFERWKVRWSGIGSHLEQDIHQLRMQLILRGMLCTSALPIHLDGVKLV
jgi:hypothetical protein